MKREEILKLIEEKEAKDLVFKTRGEEKAKRTEEIFHIIKQDVIDKVVEHCIEGGYKIDQHVVKIFTLRAILSSGQFPVNFSNCEIEIFRTVLVYFKPKEDEVVEFVESIDNELLFKNVYLLLEKHGFEREYDYFDIQYKITKEKLLSFSEIISNDAYQPKTVKTIKNPLYEVYDRDANLVTSLGKDNTLTYQVLGVIVFFIILFIWKACF